MHCKNCGMDSANPSICEWCHKPIVAASKPQAASQKPASRPREVPEPIVSKSETQKEVAKMEKKTAGKKSFISDDPKDMMMKTGILAAIGVLIIIIGHSNTILYVIGLILAIVGGIPFFMNALKLSK